MEIFEKETVVEFRLEEVYEFVIDGPMSETESDWCYADNSGIFHVKKLKHGKRTYLKDLIKKDLWILSHPCPKEIRPKIIAMLNSGDEDSIKLAEGILKNY